MLNTWNEAYIKRADDTLKRVLGSDLITVIENVINTIYEMISITCYLVNSPKFYKDENSRWYSDYGMEVALCPNMFDDETAELKFQSYNNLFSKVFGLTMKQFIDYFSVFQ